MRRSRNKINCEKDVNLRDLTAENLCIRYPNACHEVHGRGENRVVTYRLGYVTAIGNIEKKCWRSLAKTLIKKEGKIETFNTMKEQLAAQGLQNQMTPEDFEIEALSACIKQMCEEGEG